MTAADESARMPGAGEWRTNWKIVLAAFFGVGLAAVESRILGVMMKPLSQEHGWSRTEISLAPLMLSIGTLVVSPVIGSIVDRLGARTVALAAIPVFALLLAGLSLSQGDLLLFYALFALTALVGPAVGPIVWNLGVSSAFNVYRGAALGIAMSGIAAFGAITPIITQQAYHHFGIELFWVAMGVYCFVIAFPTTWLFFRDVSPGQARAGARHARPVTEDGGVTILEAVRSSRFWRMTLGLVVAAGVCGMFSVHFVAMLTDRGMSALDAALVFGAMGPATMAGRLIGGFLLDRVFAPYVAGATLVLPLVACILMLQTGVGTVPAGVVIALLVGFALGTEGDTVAYLASRYFGLRHYGKIYGVLFGLYGLGFGMGSFLAGRIYDLNQAYDTAFVVFSGLLIVAIGLLVTLGPYPVFSTSQTKVPQDG